MLGELLGQVYGEEYLGKHDLAFQNFSLQGGAVAGEVLLEVVSVRHRNVTHHPKLHLAVSTTTEELCLWSLATPPLLIKPLLCLQWTFQINRMSYRIWVALYKIKPWGPLIKMIKNFQAVTAKH